MEGRKNISNTAAVEQLYPLECPSGTADGERGFVCSTPHKSVSPLDLELWQRCQDRAGQETGTHSPTQTLAMPMGVQLLSLNLGLLLTGRNDRPDPEASTQRVY